MKWIISLWRRYQRAIDVKLIWPSCLEYSRDWDDAKLAFRLHMAMDPAYDGMTPAEKDAFVEALQ